MSDYPSYACRCCGYTNGDMFYDSLEGREATPHELAMFDGYRKAWNALKDERQRLQDEQRAFKVSRWTRHSDETRAKISATKLLKKEGK